MGFETVKLHHPTWSSSAREIMPSGLKAAPLGDSAEPTG